MPFMISTFWFVAALNLVCDEKYVGFSQPEAPQVKLRPPLSNLSNVQQSGSNLFFFHHNFGKRQNAPAV